MRWLGDGGIEVSKYGGIQFFYCDNFGGFGDCFFSSESSGCISDRVSLTASKCRVLVIEFDNYQRVFCMAVKDGFVKKLCCKKCERERLSHESFYL